MERIPRLTAALALAVILAACTTEAPTLEYHGVSTTIDATHNLTVSLRQPTANGTITGSYYTGVAPGALHGTVTDTVLTAELKPSDDCTYEFTGVLTETSLTGSFEPLECPDGQPGTWDLTRS